MFAAIRRALSLVHFRRRSSSRLVLEIRHFGAVMVAHNKADMPRAGSFGLYKYLGLGASPASTCFISFGYGLCEDVGPFSSSKTKAALAAFFLFVSSSFRASQQLRQLGDVRRDGASRLTNARVSV
jgi:hypothetical protein